MFLARAAFLLLACFTALAADPSVLGETLDRAWMKAVLDKNLDALDRMLDPGLVYAHASGIVDTKSDYLGKLKSGRQQYKTFDQQKLTVRSHGDAIVTHSWVRVTGINPQGPFDDKVMMLHVWVKQGKDWKLAAHQTTRVP